MNSVQEQINQINWFHHFDKETFGFETKGKKGVSNREEAKLWGFGKELFKDKTVLDVGASDGYFSFLAEKLGAKRVLAIDYPSWRGTGPAAKQGFDLAHQILNSKVESRVLDVLDVSPTSVGFFDVVLFLGVLYHLPNPIQGLIAVANVTKELLIVETTYEQLDESKALFELYPKRLGHDPTSFWSPNIKGVRDALTILLGIKKVLIKPWINNRVICFAHKI